MSRLTHKDISLILRSLHKAKKKEQEEVILTSGEIIRLEGIKFDFTSSDRDQDTRVKTAISWLERAGLLHRNENIVNIFPGSLKIKIRFEVEKRLMGAKVPVHRIQFYLHIFDILLDADQGRSGVTTDMLISATHRSRDEVILILKDLEKLQIIENGLDISAYISKGVKNHSLIRLERSNHLEKGVLELLQELDPEVGKGEWRPLHLRQFTQGIKSFKEIEANPDEVLKILRAIAADGKSREPGNAPGGSLEIKSFSRENYHLKFNRNWHQLELTAQRRRDVAFCILNFLLEKIPQGKMGRDLLVEVKMADLKNAVAQDLFLTSQLKNPLKAIEAALLFMHHMEILTLHKGLVVFRSAMTIKFLHEKEKTIFQQKDYLPLEEHYKEKIFQVHVIHEYAKKGLERLKDALALMTSYFQTNREEFVKRFFSKNNQVFKVATSKESYRQIVDSLNNKIQEKLVTSSINRNKLILAGPGSGKTRVIVHRLAYLLRVERVSPESILAITFNRLAAREIRGRLHNLVGNDSRGVNVFTYHALAMRLTGTSFFDREDWDQTPDFEKIIHEAIDLLKGKADFEGESDNFRERLLAGYRYILVDEYQDIDQTQYDFISAIAGRTLEDPDQKLVIMAVGDDDQNVYSFRGSDSIFINKFCQDYGVKNHDLLVENYRSTQNIIQASNFLIAKNQNRLKSSTKIKINKARNKEDSGGRWESLAKESFQGKVRILKCGSDLFEQGFTVMENLKTLSHCDPLWNWGEVAILARQKKYLNPIRAYCEEHKIPFFAGYCGEEQPRFHKIRECALFLDKLKGLQKEILDCEKINHFFNEVFPQDGGENPWLNELRNHLQDFMIVLGNGKTFAKDLAESIFESGFDKKFGPKNGIFLNTLHAAKGKEFNHVVLLDGGFDKNSEQEMESERRVYYVGMTRAKETLTLCSLFDSKNPFINEMLGHKDIYLENQGRTPHPLPDYLKWEYALATLRDVDLSFSGRRGESDPIHFEIAKLQPGDPLELTLEKDRFILLNSKGEKIGRMSNNFNYPRGKIIQVWVSCVVRRSKSQIVEDKWRALTKMDAWDVVVPEIKILPE